VLVSQPNATIAAPAAPEPANASMPAAPAADAAVAAPAAAPVDANATADTAVAAEPLPDAPTVMPASPLNEAASAETAPAAAPAAAPPAAEAAAEALAPLPPSRVWFVCEGAPFAPRSAEEELNGVRRVNTMRCTAEMTSEELCCAPWATGLSFPRAPAGVNLDAAQVPPSSMLWMKPSGTMSSDIAIVCTADSGSSEDQVGVELPMQCASREFSLAELRGDWHLAPGQAVQDLRIEYLAQQGVPADRIPTCAEIAECPGGGAPATPGPEVMDELKGLSFLKRRTIALPTVQMTDGTLTLLGSAAPAAPLPLPDAAPQPSPDVAPADLEAAATASDAAVAAPEAAVAEAAAPVDPNATVDAAVAAEAAAPVEANATADAAVAAEAVAPVDPNATADAAVDPNATASAVEDAMAAAGADAAVDPNATADAAVAGTVIEAEADAAVAAAADAAVDLNATADAAVPAPEAVLQPASADPAAPNATASDAAVAVNATAA